MIADAAIISQKTGHELRTVYVWMFKHDVTRHRVVRYAKAGGWNKIADCIDRDRPLEWMVAGALKEVSK